MIVRGVVPYPSRQSDITVMLPFTKKAHFIEILYFNIQILLVILFHIHFMAELYLNLVLRFIMI